MLLTLAVSSLRSMMDGRGEQPKLAVDDVPRFAHDELGLHGLTISASMLSGWTLVQIERLRDQADKAACPCLLLVDDEPLDLASANDRTRSAAADRLSRLATAANRLGCSSVAIGCKGKDTPDLFDRAVATLKAAIPTVDRLELSVLIRPMPGMLEDPARLTELIKRVGGFRIGSLPDFGHAARTGNPEIALRRLAPYAGAILATVEGFDGGAHRGCDLAACVRAISSVGYQNTLAIQYVGNGQAKEEITRARECLAAAIKGDELEEPVELDELAPNLVVEVESEGDAAVPPGSDGDDSSETDEGEEV